MDGPLLDQEGYPRSDIDLYAVRIARNKIICEYVRGAGAVTVVCGGEMIWLSSPMASLETWLWFKIQK